MSASAVAQAAASQHPPSRRRHRSHRLVSGGFEHALNQLQVEAADQLGISTRAEEMGNDAIRCRHRLSERADTRTGTTHRRRRCPTCCLAQPDVTRPPSLSRKFTKRPRPPLPPAGRRCVAVRSPRAPAAQASTTSPGVQFRGLIARAPEHNCRQELPHRSACRDGKRQACAGSAHTHLPPTSDRQERSPR
jgi:hypothetical protein